MIDLFGDKVAGLFLAGQGSFFLKVNMPISKI